MLARVVVATCLLVSLSAGAATLPQAFACGREGSAGGLGAGTELVRYFVDVARHPDAICNDGSPAAFYYAPHTRPDDRDKWILFLQGGGSCFDGQSCAQRWCSVETNYGLDKMSSSATKPQIRANGFLNPTAENRFGTWNRVLIYYCSSDAWSGDNSRTLQATLSDGATRDYEIHFKGARIIDAVIDTLRHASRRRRAARPAAGGGATAYAWPDLDSATAVIFAGSSAGGAGARANLDRVAAKLRATNPTVDVRGIIDAIYGGLGEKRDWTRSTYCAADPARGCSYESFVKATRQAVETELYAARDDESCLRWHQTQAPGTEWRCSDGEHVMLHHLQTPFFVRIDLLDTSIGGDYVERGFGAPADFARAVESEMRNLPFPEEARGATPGQFVPQCTDHEAFTDNKAVFNVRVLGVNWHDTVWNWWTGAQPQQRIRQFTGQARPAPECP